MPKDKYAAELDFWEREQTQYIRWYSGGLRELYGIPRPSGPQKIIRHNNPFRDALETWVNADRWRYCRHLLIEPTYWRGCSILEVGCGPLGLAQFFAGSHITGIDPLALEYIKLGYPPNIHVIPSPIEEIPLPEHRQYDAAFSVNAIDHVDDFHKAVESLERVVRPEGEIRIEVHYHQPTTTEPHSLNDEIVASAFQKFGMKKISSLPSKTWYPPGTHPVTDEFALWSNRDYLWSGALSLR